jgi:site-specific DNA-methyltransferase (adenine-specific)
MRKFSQLYTFKTDVVLDPFCGSGSTCLAAFKDGRHYIGYDIDTEYVKLANQRIKACSDKVIKTL